MPPFVGLGNVQIAGAELEHTLHQRHSATQILRRDERAVKPRAAVFRPAGYGHSREILIHGNLEVRERLAVSETLVEPRLNVLYQPVLAKQRLDLAFAFQPVDLSHQGGHHPLYLRPARPDKVGRGLEVTRHARPQILGLADVQHHAGVILEQVHPRRRRQFAGPAAKVLDSVRSPGAHAHIIATCRRSMAPSIGRTML